LYQHDQTLFDNLQLPAEFTTDDRETLINNLLMECAEFEIIFPNFEFCKAAIGFWSKSRLRVWQKLYATMFFEYNPIWNKDGTITETRTKEYSDEKAGTTESTKESTSESDDALSGSHITSGTQESSTENKTAGFNSSDYVKHDKSDVNASSSETGTNTARRTVNDSGSESGSTTESGTTSGEESEEYVRTEQGNIGLTSTQQLIKEEREVDMFEIDEVIINDFKKQFCILVY
jgi:hypothetical protein